jgi:anaerobic ribonucleoside-triphosphate reductase
METLAIKKFINIYSYVLNELNNKLDKLDENELMNLAENNIEIIINFRSNIKSKRNKKEKNYSVDNYGEILDQIKNIKSREEASIFLNNLFTKKIELERFARFLDLPISKEDKASKLVEKIIEATIGYILRSKAIQGTNN